MGQFMNLTKFIKNNKIRELFKEVFEKPRLTDQKEFLSPPIKPGAS